MYKFVYYHYQFINNINLNPFSFAGNFGNKSQPMNSMAGSNLKSPMGGAPMGGPMAGGVMGGGMGGSGPMGGGGSNQGSPMHKPAWSPTHQPNYGRSFFLM